MEAPGTPSDELELARCAPIGRHQLVLSHARTADRSRRMQCRADRFGPVDADAKTPGRTRRLQFADRDADLRPGYPRGALSSCGLMVPGGGTCTGIPHVRLPWSAGGWAASDS